MPEFAAALGQYQISMHAVVLGELASGNLVKRAETLADLRRLPRATAGTLEETLDFIEMQSLYGRGLGWNDIQLLVAARLSGHFLWSLDTRLAVAAGKLRIGLR